MNSFLLGPHLFYRRMISKGNKARTQKVIFLEVFILWPASQVQAFTCVCMACEVRIFLFFYLLKNFFIIIFYEGFFKQVNFFFTTTMCTIINTLNSINYKNCRNLFSLLSYKYPHSIFYFASWLTKPIMFTVSEHTKQLPW